MKISANNIGNYSPALRTDPGYKKVTAESNPEMKIKSQSPETTAITKEEKNFFIGLYPQNQNEISEYYFYQKSGKMSGVQIGSQFDRRG